MPIPVNGTTPVATPIPKNMAPPIVNPTPSKTRGRIFIVIFTGIYIQ
jgi:hypothetical protein